jgi:hypothetical protein
VPSEYIRFAQTVSFSERTVLPHKEPVVPSGAAFPILKPIAMLAFRAGVAPLESSAVHGALYSQLRTVMVSNLDMRRVTIALILLLLILAPLIAQTDKGKPNEAQTHRAPNVPRTVDEAVSVLKTSWLSAKDLDWLLRNPQKQAVAILYRPFGMGVRNQFGLWGDNQQLRDSCGENNPEGCSVVIFNRLWESVRSDADASLVRQLDCQFQLAEAIRVNYKGFHNLTIGALQKKLQSQIDDQTAKFEATAPPARLH